MPYRESDILVLSSANTQTELLAVFVALRTWPEELWGNELLVYDDSSATMGNVQNPSGSDPAGRRPTPDHNLVPVNPRPGKRMRCIVATTGPVQAERYAGQSKAARRKFPGAGDSI